MCNNYYFSKKQLGAALPISLIMLLLLTLIGVSGVQVASLEETMAGNARFQSQTFQAAEIGLLAGETVIQDMDLDAFNNFVLIDRNNDGLLFG